MRVERHYPHPIDKVWTAVTDPEHLRQWFPSPVEVDLRPGGAMRFTAFEGDAEDESGATGTVDEVEAPRRLSFRWGDDHLTFDLTSEDGGTTFALTHSFDDRYGGPSFATGWEVCLGGLRSVLAGEPVPPPDPVSRATRNSCTSSVSTRRRSPGPTADGRCGSSGNSRVPRRSPGTCGWGSIR